MRTTLITIALTMIIFPFFFPSAMAAQKPLKHEKALARFQATLFDIETKREELLSAYKMAPNNNERLAVHRAAEKYLVQKFYTHVAPAWLGMPWTMAVVDDGLEPDSRVPFEEGKGVSCSWFVVSILENLGLKLGNPRGFAGTIAVHLQKSLSPRKQDLKRFFHVTPEKLKEELIKWGDGLYIIGLNCHVGFVHVEEKAVTFIHAAYTSPMQVVMEPLTQSEAISLSEDAGYVVSALFKDNRLIHHWLTGSRVFFNGPRK